MTEKQKEYFRNLFEAFDTLTKKINEDKWMYIEMYKEMTKEFPVGVRCFDAFLVNEEFLEEEGSV